MKCVDTEDSETEDSVCYQVIRMYYTLHYNVQWILSSLFIILIYTSYPRRRGGKSVLEPAYFSLDFHLYQLPAASLGKSRCYPKAESVAPVLLSSLVCVQLHETCLEQFLHFKTLAE